MLKVIELILVEEIVHRTHESCFQQKFEIFYTIQPFLLRSRYDRYVVALFLSSRSFFFFLSLQTN